MTKTIGDTALLSKLTIPELDIIVLHSSMNSLKKSKWKKVDYINNISRHYGDGTQLDKYVMKVEN
jgi:aminoglycoside N3'-acetyltransferase